MYNALTDGTQGYPCEGSMFQISTTRDIPKPAGEVWALLSNFRDYTWNSFTPHTTCSLRPLPGEKFVLSAQMYSWTPLQKIDLSITRYSDSDMTVVWEGLGPAHRAERLQRVIKTSDTSCRYETHERFTGIMSHVIGLLRTRLKHNFERVADDLLGRSEQISHIA